MLPVYYADNYISLLPGETRQVDIAVPVGHPARVGLRGWNVVPATGEVR